MLQSVHTILVGVTALLAQLLFGPLLFVTARTGRGQFVGLTCGLAAILLTSFLFFVVFGIADAGFDRSGPYLILTGVTLALILATIPFHIYFRRPPVEVSSPISSHFLAKWEPKRFGWDDVEDEYTLLFIQLASRLAVWIGSDERRKARAAVSEMVAEMRDSPDYCRLPRVVSTLGFMLRSGRLDPSHLYSYRPPPRGDCETFGVLMFLHGHGPNALLLLHALRPVADESRLVLVAPSFGYGNWEAPGGVAAVERAVDFALAAFPTDPNRVFLAGLSQGGAGVSQAAAASDRYAGLIFLSAVMEAAICGTEPLAARWPRLPALILHGECDDHVRFRSVAESVEAIEAAGGRVAKEYHADRNHLLYFAEHRAINRRIAEWIRGVAPPA